MEQASKPLKVAELEEVEVAVRQPNLEQLNLEQPDGEEHVKPATILHWGKTHKPELALMGGMSCVILAASGAALSLLFNPHLGQTITYDPLIDEATLAASRRISLGEQLLDQMARVLEIEIIETQGPNVGRRSGAVPAMTIVAQADKAAALPEADLGVGLKAMVIAAGVGLGITGLIRLFPLLPPLPPLGKQRRLPLSQRLPATTGIAHPLAPGSRPHRPTQASTLMPEALTSLDVSGPVSRNVQHMAGESHPPRSSSRHRRHARRSRRRVMFIQPKRFALKKRTALGRPHPPGSNQAPPNQVPQPSCASEPSHHPSSPAKLGHPQQPSHPPKSFVLMNSVAGTNAVIPETQPSQRPASRSALLPNAKAHF